MKHTHLDLFGLDGTHFISDLPFLQRRKELAKKHLEKLTYENADPSKIKAVKNALELFEAIIEDIYKSVKDNNDAIHQTNS